MNQKIRYGLVVLIVFLGIMSHLTSNAQEFGKLNIEAINTGSLQIQGVTWCRKYFDQCIFSEKWIGPILRDRQLVSPEVFVTIQTGITNPEINEFVQDHNELYRITFTYDQNKIHERWGVDK
jgi:hypothetical protein